MPGCTGFKHVKQAGDTPYCGVPVELPCARGYFSAKKPDEVIGPINTAPSPYWKNISAASAS